MEVQFRTSFDSLAEWIQATDQHAAARLELARRARGLLDDLEHAPRDDREEVAMKLERWRYQLLNERSGHLAGRDAELAGLIDLAANELAGRETRMPRDARAALASSAEPGRAAADAASALDADLEELCRRAADITRKSFGSAESAGQWRMLLYAPLYLSNECINLCPYCGFNYRLDVRRKHLTPAQALDQAEILRERGFRHTLLVAGEMPSLTTTDYYADLIRTLAARGIRPAIEIAPQSTSSYAELVRAGACGITLYQETYDERLYRVYHSRGPKASFDWRLEGVERAAEAGIGRLGLGILLGLAEPRGDFMRLVRHAEYLAARFPRRTLAFGLPRLHETPEKFEIPYAVGDDDLVRFYAALRIAFPAAELVLSTRETPALRARLAKICITEMSAGSSTAPGGYGDSGAANGQQFPIVDHRTPAEVADWLLHAGFAPVWEVPHTKS